MHRSTQQDRAVRAVVDAVRATDGPREHIVIEAVAGTGRLRPHRPRPGRGPARRLRCWKSSARCDTRRRRRAFSCWPSTWKSRPADRFIGGACARWRVNCATGFPSRTSMYSPSTRSGCERCGTAGPAPTAFVGDGRRTGIRRWAAPEQTPPPHAAAHRSRQSVQNVAAIGRRIGGFAAPMADHPRRGRSHAPGRRGTRRVRRPRPPHRAGHDRRPRHHRHRGSDTRGCSPKRIEHPRIHIIPWCTGGASRTATTSSWWTRARDSGVPGRRNAGATPTSTAHSIVCCANASSLRDPPRCCAPSGTRCRRCTAPETHVITEAGAVRIPRSRSFPCSSVVRRWRAHRFHGATGGAVRGPTHPPHLLLPMSTTTHLPGRSDQPAHPIGPRHPAGDGGHSHHRASLRHPARRPRGKAGGHGGLPRPQQRRPRGARCRETHRAPRPR